MSDNLSLVTRTIRNAMTDLPSFLVIFTGAILSYAIIGHLLFGPHIKEWGLLTNALVTCWDMMRWTGWRFERLYVHVEGDKMAVTVAAVYYYSYVILMQFMHANILTAILMAGYQSVRAEMRKEGYHSFRAEAGSTTTNELRALGLALEQLRRKISPQRALERGPLAWSEERWLNNLHLVHTHYLLETGRQRRLPFGVEYKPETNTAKGALHMRISRLLCEIADLPANKADDVLMQAVLYFDLSVRGVNEHKRRSRFAAELETKARDPKGGKVRSQSMTLLTAGISPNRQSANKDVDRESTRRSGAA